MVKTPSITVVPSAISSHISCSSSCKSLEQLSLLQDEFLGGDAAAQVGQTLTSMGNLVTKPRLGRSTWSWVAVGCRAPVQWEALSTAALPHCRTPCSCGLAVISRLFSASGHSPPGDVTVALFHQQQGHRNSAAEPTGTPLG